MICSGEDPDKAVTPLLGFPRVIVTGDDVKYESFWSTSTVTAVSCWVEAESATAIIAGAISPASISWSEAI